MFPNGLDITEYPGYQTWTNAAWAWQFLRRNEKFQKRCDHIRSWPNSKLKRMWRRNIAHAFSLKKFKDYQEDFATGKRPNPEFSSDTVSFWARVDESQYDSLVLPSNLRTGQALVRFDIEAMRKSKKSLSAQISDAKNVLNALLEDHLKNTKCKTRNTKLKAPPIEFLQAFDAEKFKKTALGESLTYEVIGNAILPQTPPPLDPIGDIRSRIERGSEYVEALYLDLAAMKQK